MENETLAARFVPALIGWTAMVYACAGCSPATNGSQATMEGGTGAEAVRKGATGGHEAAPLMDGARPDAFVGDGSLDSAMGMDAGVEPSVFSVKPLAGLPSYSGSRDNSAACMTTYGLAGHGPSTPASGPYPLALYFGGTEFIPGTPANRHDGPAPMAVTEAMARRGFVALSVQYDNTPAAWLSDHQNQLSCMLGPERSESLVAVACALPDVDCGRGIATWGQSLGGLVAVVAHDFEPRVKAAWATGYGGDVTATLPMDRLRVVNAEHDVNGEKATLDFAAGVSSDRCAEDADTCLRANGSGWIRVRQADLRNPDSREAGHCWFDRASCTTGQIVLEPNWVEPNSEKAFALERNADWLAATARLP